ncbi:hypothetical protein [Haliangium sp.]|uniref:hypothetical protein n=1 Tax=Haliangium sp. TaxID=2663208 RepID=UPI003D141F55
MIRAITPTGVAPPGDRAETQAAVRRAVRTALEHMPGYHQAAPALRRKVARNMVDVSMAAADLIGSDLALTRAAAEAASSRPAAIAATSRTTAAALATPVTAAPLAAAQASNMGQTAREGARVVEETRNAIDFPTFVESLITGVFRAISNANVGQFEKFSSLIEGVAASSDDFARTVPDAEAERWLAESMPELGLRRDPNSGELAVGEDADFEEARPLLARSIEATSGEIGQVDESELRTTLLPLVKRKLARDRQSTLAAMIQMGLQRIVVDEGRLHASMDMRVDTHAVQERLAQQQTEVDVTASASGAASGLGWGVKASLDTSVAHVQSDSEYSQDELNMQAGLRSSVDLAFRTDQVPLDRVASQDARAKIKAKAPDPAAVSGPASAAAPTSKLRSQFGTLSRLTPRTGGDKDKDKPEHIGLEDIPKSQAERDADKKQQTLRDASGGAGDKAAAGVKPAPGDKAGAVKPAVKGTNPGVSN